MEIFLIVNCEIIHLKFIAEIRNCVVDFHRDNSMNFNHEQWIVVSRKSYENNCYPNWIILILWTIANVDI